MKYLEALLISTLAIFAPIEHILASVLALCFSDLITGVLAARKRGEKITSAELRRTVSKLVIYELALCLAFIAEKYLLDGFLPIVKLISSMIGVVELKSIFENLDTINGTPLLQGIIDRLGSKNQQK